MNRVDVKALLRAGVLAVALLCATCGARAHEVRAFWVDAWAAGFLNQSQVASLLGVPGNGSSRGQIRDGNLNTVVVQIRRRADVCYPSALGEPYMSSLTPSNFNALQAIVDAAHDTTGGKARINVVAWFVIFPTGTGAVYQAHSNPADPANYWMSRNSSGQEDGGSGDDYGLDPGHPNAEEYMVNLALDVACNFDVDGIQMDRIRYVGPTWGYNPTSVARFNAFHGRSGTPAYTDETWKLWRRDQITNFMRKVYAKTMYVKPSVDVSAAVVTWYPGPSASTRSAFQNTRPYYDVFQDWDAWMQEGILDICYTMDYIDQEAWYADHYIKWMDFQKDRKFNRHTVVGPGVYLNSLDNAILQLQMTRNASPSGNYAQGYCGYAYKEPYDGGNWAGFAPRLLSDVNPTPDTPPALPWKTSPTAGHIMGTVTYYATGDWADGAMVTATGPVTRSIYCDGTGFYAFIDLPPGTYTVTASKSGYSNLSAPVTLTAGSTIQRNFGLGSTDVTNPSTPNGLSATAISPTRISLSWTASTDNVGVAGYSIYRRGYKIGSTGSTSYIDTSCTPSTNYSYRVAAYDPSGNESPMSTAAGATTPASIEIILDEESASYTGSWTYSTVSSGAYNNDYRYAITASSETATAIYRPNITTAGLYDVYVMYREGINRTTNAPYTTYWDGGSGLVRVNQETNGGTWVLIQSARPFQTGTSGYVKLGNNTSDTGEAVIADAVRFLYAGAIAGPPSAPTDGTPVANSTTGITWKWSDVADETGYRVKDTSGVTKSGDLAANTVQWTENSLVPNTQYTRKIYAFNTYGESSGSTGQSRYTLAKAGESTDGTGNTGNVYCTTATKNTWYPAGKAFTFFNPAGFGTGGTWKATKFEYKWNKSTTESWASAGTTWNTGTISLTPNQSDGDYYLHVRAFNGDNTANNTDKLSYGPFKCDVTSPADVTANDEGSYTPSLDTLRANWTASSDTGGSDLHSYEYAVGTSVNTQDVKAWTSAALNTSVTITGLSLVEGNSYYIQVRAKDTAGNFSAVSVTDGIIAAVGVSPISSAWSKANGTEPLSLRNKVVTAKIGDAFWLEELDRSNAIKVLSGVSVAKGNTVSVAGVLGMSGTQRVLLGDVVINAGGSVLIQPLGVTTKWLGGGNYNPLTPGVTGGVGQYNIGLLVCCWGKVTYSNTTDPSNKYFYLDDGSGLSSGGQAGVKVWCGTLTPPSSGTVIVNGIVSSESIGGRVVPVVLVREAGDVLIP